MDPSYTMPPTNYDALLQNRLSRSQLLRQLSAHSSSTSGSRKGTARVKKQTSATNSPHNVQRRRTTANHTTRMSPHQTSEQRLRNYHSSLHHVPFVRPMSWHPGSEAIHTPARHVPTYEPAIGNTIEGLQNLAVSGTPSSSVQQSFENALALGYGFPITVPTPLEQSPMEMGGYGGHDAAPMPTYDLYPSYDVPEQPQYRYTSQAPTYDSYPPMSYHMQQWSQLQPYLASQTAHAPPEYLPVQGPVKCPQESQTNTRPQMARRRSKELVSIGLYDNDDNNFMSALNSAVSSNPRRDSLGKGLKLEETWQPPNDDEGEDEEGYSTDEGEDMDEVPPVHASVAPEIQASFFPPPYGDLSNQSFFITDDDQYASESHYTDYYNINQDYQYYQDTQPKVVDPAMGSFLYF